MQSATHTLGRVRIEMEAEYEAAGGDKNVQTLVLRAGDYLDAQKGGNWFDSQIASKLDKGIITYPGPLNIPHAWAYLPDMARAMVQLVDRREQLSNFEVYGFAGFTLTGQELVRAIEAVTATKFRVGAMPLPMLKLIAVFSPDVKGVVETSYLWRTPNTIDGTKLAAAIPDFQTTAVEVAMTTIIHGLFPQFQQSTAA